MVVEREVATVIRDPQDLSPGLKHKLCSPLVLPSSSTGENQCAPSNLLSPDPNWNPICQEKKRKQKRPLGSQTLCPPQSDLRKVQQGAKCEGVTGSGRRWQVDGAGVGSHTEEAAEAETHFQATVRQSTDSATGTRGGCAKL